MHLEPWQWAVAIFGALLVGLTKTGFSGAGMVFVVLFAQILPARASTGIVLPLLISADIIAVTVFRRHAVWRHLWHMFPWSAAGIVLGYFAMKHINDVQLKHLIGLTTIAMVAIHVVRKRMADKEAERPHPSPLLGKERELEQEPHPGPLLAKERETDVAVSEPVVEEMKHRASLVYVATMGLLAGFTTMTANAAGPVMILYLLAMGLPKMEFIGTGAWYFFIINLFKVPFSYGQGLINGPSLLFDIELVPAVILGALSGRYLVSKINQNAFEIMALAFAVLGAVKLLW